ncbi:MAG TPA: HEAT repeat domain-containing protein [Gemmatimonadales bacterium]|nr:HEAT repeat domain-containing protein [Gemmatimonadales bacterium]
MTPDSSDVMNSPMAQALERLVIVVRETPRATEVHATLAEQAARTAAALSGPERIEAGVEGSAIPLGTSLRGRLLARAVDWVEIRPAASAAVLLQLAGALASDDIAMPLLDHVVVTMVPLPLPVSAAETIHVAEADGDGGTGADEDEPADQELTRLTDEVRSASVQRDWPTLLARARALLDYADEDPSARRTRIIQARRALPLARLRELIEHALRHAEDQSLTAEILGRIGPDGHQAMVESVAGSDSLAARRFLHDQLGRTPEAFPLLLPLLERGSASQARHAAAILGRLGDTRAVPALAAALTLDDDGVRAEALRALVKFDLPEARAALLDGLKHSSASTRITAAQAVGNAGLLALAPSIMAVLREEEDSSVRRAMATAAARLGTVEAMEELVRMALARRRLFRGGQALEVRLDVVAGLAAAASPAARRALDRIAREADRPVQAAADQALNVRRR